MNQAQAYDAGRTGKPEPEKIFKRVRFTDSETGEVMEGLVETEESLKVRLAYHRGVDGPVNLFERWLAERFESLERRLAAADVTNSDGVENFELDPVVVEGIGPRSIHEDYYR